MYGGKIALRIVTLIMGAVLFAGAGQSVLMGGSERLEKDCAAAESGARIGRIFRVWRGMVLAAGEEDWLMEQTAPGRYRMYIDRFWSWIDYFLEVHYASDQERYEALSRAVDQLIDHDGGLYFGGFKEGEVRIFADMVYDRDGQYYDAFTFFLPDNTYPAARLYVNEKTFYASDGVRFWSSDPRMAQMPELYSPVERARQRIGEYLNAVGQAKEYEITYRGMVRRDDLERYMNAFYYAVWERDADGAETVWDAYVDDMLYYSDAFYAQLADNRYEKRQLCEWTSGEGDTYQFAFANGFCLADGSVCYEGDTKVVVCRNGVVQGHFSYEFNEWRRPSGFWRVGDYTFDDIPDIAVVKGSITNWGGRGAELYVGDGRGQYHYGGYFDDIPVVDYPTQTLRVNARQGSGYYVYFAYRYRDGSFVETALLEEGYLDNDPRSVVASGVVYTLTDENGNVETYEDELPEKWAEFWGI